LNDFKIGSFFPDLIKLLKIHEVFSYRCICCSLPERCLGHKRLLQT